MRTSVSASRHDESASTISSRVTGRQISADDLSRMLAGKEPMLVALFSLAGAYAPRDKESEL